MQHALAPVNVDYLICHSIIPLMGLYHLSAWEEPISWSSALSDTRECYTVIPAE